MALNIKDERAVELAGEVAELTGESKTRAVRVALEERKRRIAGRVSTPDRAQRLRDFLEHEAWAQIPSDLLGQPMPKDEREAILGFGPEGV